MNSFYQVFCEVDFLCYAGSPNWLGWMVITYAALVILNWLT